MLSHLAPKIKTKIRIQRRKKRRSQRSKLRRKKKSPKNQNSKKRLIQASWERN
jgi:hypothetical protein